MKLTANQFQTLQRLAPYAGQRVLVITSIYDANIAEKARHIAVGIGFNASALRGLHNRGVLTIETFWKGAWVTVPADVTQYIAT